ncbi:hypothetical protein [Noviherbaspirillum denitrificans]|uniref:Uncharacterized protein n=1 Tax=Noviherbaspirillum denitrificans TaxID=1968433 RepID=A0A254TNS7_9BURK|nr:hypothetical protein [Noviherbaspirillum denitrificans]OWW21358.1 hypothetical protein AYR66_19605 [Noviherbaspirillum denitrificans]
MNTLHHPVIDTVDTRKALLNLSRSLRRLHQALVQLARRAYEKEWGAVDSGQLLQLLTRHPDFDWLHALSELMVDIDEILDLDQLTARDLKTAHDAVEQLLTLQEGNVTGFSSRYFAALHDDPAIVIAHVDVLRALQDK